MIDPVLVLSNQRDYAADAVIERLRERDAPVVRWNAETLNQDACSWSPPAAVRFRSVWLRDYLPLAPSEPTVDELDEYLVLRAQWRDWVASVEDCSDCWVNPLWASRRAENKIVQLRTAGTVGLQVPATVVTNRAEQARLFATAQPRGAIVKPGCTDGFFG